VKPLRQNFSSGAKWESIVGYSRAVRFGSRIYVTGTTATDERSDVVGTGDPYAQTIQALRNVERALRQAGAALTDVVRVRLYVTDISTWQEIGRAHAELLGNVLPATTMVEVKGLIDPRMLVEIEVDAELPPENMA
jgi:enamine deaminase RidA (YjgF/YER057c/UK114 family)